MNNWVPLAWVAKHSAGAVRQGIAFDSLLDSVLVDARSGANSAFVSPAQWLLLCMNTSMRLDDATHGLAREGFASGFPLIGLRAVRGCATLEAAVRCVQHLYGLASRSIRIHLSIGDDQAILGVEADCLNEEDRAVLEDTYLSWMYMHFVYYLGRPLPVLGVTTSDPSHFSMGHSHYAIGAPTRYGRHASLRFAKSLLSQRGVCRADENPPWECFRLWLDFAQGDSGGQFVADGSLSSPDLDELALKSQVSRSTIYRRLRASEGGIRLQRRRALTEAAVKLLRDTDCSVDAIGAELGYSDARSFRRFLKAATGKTPQEHRRTVFGEGLQVDEAVRQRLREIGRDAGG